MNTTPEIIRVSSKSSPHGTARVIKSLLMTDGSVEIYAIGAGAVNQAVKSIAIAKSNLASYRGAGIFCTPSFENISIDGLERTVIRMTVRLGTFFTLARKSK